MTTSDLAPATPATLERASRATQLPDAVPGLLERLASSAGRLAFYVAGPRAGRPLLLVHSVNAAGSAAEVRPVFEHFARTRPVYALELPGFGASERSQRDFTPRLMTDAVLALVAHIAAEYRDTPIDVMGVSLGCEFVARAAVERPAAFSTLALVSPTGLEREEKHFGKPAASREIRWLHWLLTRDFWREQLFGLLRRPAVVRYFLKRTFGSDQIDERLYRYSLLTTRQPNASHAPLAFLAAQPFAADINRVYREISQPVWLAHGTRGDFTHFEGAKELVASGKWRRTVFSTGAMPYFEQRVSFLQEFDTFINKAGHP